jgi:hypothetical protein
MLKNMNVRKVANIQFGIDAVFAAMFIGGGIAIWAMCFTR